MHGIRTFAVAVFLFSLLLSHPTASLTCRKESSCRCVQDDGKVFDLSAVGSHDPSKPKFSVTVPGNGNILQYNPCYGFKCVSDKPSTAAFCDSYPGTPTAFNGGNQDSAAFSFDASNNLQIKYTGDYNTVMTFVCTQGPDKIDLQADGIDYKGTYTSKNACFVDSSGPSSSSSSGLSLGDILLIIFFVSIVVYLVSGILFQALIKKQRGLDMIPNKSFWTGLPGNVRDGGRFAVSKVKGATRAGYSDI